MLSTIMKILDVAKDLQKDANIHAFKNRRFIFIIYRIAYMYLTISMTSGNACRGL